MGLNPLIKARAVRLAEQGYAAFALDLYGAEDLDLPAAQTNSAELMRTPGLLRKRAFVGLEAALRLPNIDPLTVRGSRLLPRRPDGPGTCPRRRSHPGRHWCAPRLQAGRGQHGRSNPR